MSETVSTRLPRELIELMVREAGAKGISISMLLREIVEEHYGVGNGRPSERPFILQLQEILNTLGKAKMGNCPYREGCPLDALNPSPLLCALCQVHNHVVGLLGTSLFNPYVGLNEADKSIS